ncbi:MAG: acylphosphatase [Bryobacteraceae bacterium]
MGVVARRWLVRGRVQGVGFRNFVRREATELSLAGWVRNRDDGRVEVLAQGLVSALDALQGRLWQGPRWAEVRDVEISEASEISGSAEFKIL